VGRLVFVRPNSVGKHGFFDFTPAEPARADDRGSKHFLHTLLASEEDFTLPQPTMILCDRDSNQVAYMRGKASPVGR
jgi:hypothetical protein